jgi:hypothetical protein
MFYQQEEHSSFVITVGTEPLKQQAISRRNVLPLSLLWVVAHSSNRLSAGGTFFLCHYGGQWATQATGYQQEERSSFVITVGSEPLKQQANSRGNGIDPIVRNFLLTEIWKGSHRHPIVQLISCPVLPIRKGSDFSSFLSWIPALWRHGPQRSHRSILYWCRYWLGAKDQG